MKKIRLTDFTDAGGCGCKISPQYLHELLKTIKIRANKNNLLAGNYHNDDAAVMSMNKNQSLVFTDDFFTPVVDDPYYFGKIAACNAVSDIYAMGAIPKIALSILGWPVNEIPIQYARLVLKGAKSICDKINVPLAGGHSIINPQPVFGLSVVGFINPRHLKLNTSAKQGDLLYLTKPIGTGIYSTANKLNKITASDKKEMINTMTILNSIGIELSRRRYINAVTDVTGFGLLGHLLEICNASKVQAELWFDNVRILKNFKKYWDEGIITSGGKRNWKSYESAVSLDDNFKIAVLTDPQTNGGLLVTVNEKNQKKFETFLCDNGMAPYSSPVGVLKSWSKKTKTIITIN